ncbi:MAG: methyltransferase domain-containing protein [Chlamydiae bacterium]|nr:methyltransferase domain-containing protein [Chlamydiota bacterium]
MQRQFRLYTNALKPILLELKEPVTECIGTPWRVVNVRAWKTPPKSEEFGPSNWHTDGMPSAVLKIMFYPLGASSEKGTVALQLPHGVHTIEEGAGAWVLFRNSELVHKAVNPRIGERIAIEITLLPSLTYDLRPISAGQNARHPYTPLGKPYTSNHPRYRSGEVVGVNIGGGPNWNCAGWVNLEEVPSSSNLYPFRLFPNCRFPMEDGSVKTVYTSHAMEHLNIPTAYRALCEAHRILEEGGDLIIKIPDYDKALDCWRRQDPSFFSSGWNIESVTPSWSSKGLYDCLDYRAAMIFCSFFNDAYGNPFGSASGSDPGQVYFGPPIVNIDFLRDLIKDRSPSQITKELRKAIGSKENNFHFCHQAAWSREELKTILNEFGFEMVSFDPNVIIGTFGNIPGIHEMRDLSTFCWAKKNR